MIHGWVVVSGANPDGYRGVDRLPWGVVDNAYYAGKLPDDVRRLYEHVRDSPRLGFWQPIATSVRTAASLYEYTRSEAGDAELLGVRSPYLSALDNPLLPCREATFLGYDVVAVGEWSLLRSFAEERGGHRDRPESRYISTLVNTSYLLRRSADAEVVEGLYRKVASSNLLEPIAPVASGLPVEAVAVFSVDPDEAGRNSEGIRQSAKA